MRTTSDHASLAVRLEAPPPDVWQFFDWPNLAMLYPAGQLRRVEYLSTAAVVGAVRKLEFVDGGAICERLEIYEPDDFHLVYRVIDTGVAPLAEYLGDLRLTRAGARACSVRMACEFTPLGASAGEFASFWQELNRATLAFIRSRVEAA